MSDRFLKKLVLVTSTSEYISKYSVPGSLVAVFASVIVLLGFLGDVWTYVIFALGLFGSLSIHSYGVWKVWKGMFSR